MKNPLSVLFFGLAAFLLLQAQAFAAAPAYRASGAFAASSAAAGHLIAYPASMQANDVCLLAIESENEAISLTTAQGFVLMAETSNGPAGAGGSTRLAIYWKRTVGGDAQPRVADSGNHTTAQIHCFSGVVGTGNPWDVFVASNEASDTTGSITGGATGVVDTLLVFFVSSSRNATSTTNCSGWTNGAPSSLAVNEETDNTNTINAGGGHCMATATWNSAGTYGDTAVTLSAATRKAMFSIALRPNATAVATDSDPAAATVAPNPNIGPPTVYDANLFSVQTNFATEVITSMTVNLSDGTGIGRIAITDNADVELGGVNTPASGLLAIPLSVTNLTATTTLTTYKVRVTPLIHSSMPAPAGAAYAVTAPISSWAGSTYSHDNADTDAAALTIDNLSPAAPAVPGCSPGATQLSFSWTNPGDADFESTVVLRATAAVTDVPVEGTTYAGGEAVGAATVACVSVGGTSCSDTTAPVATDHHYRIFSRDSRGNYSSTGATTGSVCRAALDSFNVVEVAADPATGVLKTKIAGADISAQIVARNSSNGLLTDFDKQVTLELVDGAGAAACNLRALVKALSNQTFVAGTGRKTLDAGQFEANSYKDLRFRVTYTQGAVTITSCSTDNFANRPNAFASVAASDANRTTAGGTNPLNNTSNPGTGNVHNAGRPFRIVATAVNGAGSPAATTNYDPDAGQPVAVVSQCGVAGVCSATLGALTTTTGDFSHAAGVITSDTASYDNAGAISVVLEDRSFANVDTADSSTAERYITSAAATFGRFVPDHFTVSAVTLTPRSDIGACSGSSFTYMDESLSFAFTLTARAFGGATTSAYAGATLGALPLTPVSNFNLGARSGAGANLTSRLDTGGTTTVTGGGWVAGVAAMTAVPTMVRRATPDNPDGPHTGILFGIAPSDPDTVLMQAYDLDVDGAGGNDHTSLGVSHAARYGRLRVSSAMGSEKLALTVPMEVQHWSGTAFVRNTDDSCTTLGRDAVALSFTPASNLSNTNCETALSAATLTAASGLVAASLVAPGTGNNGSVLITPQLRTASVSGSSCPAQGAAPTVIPGTIPGREYLRGRWNDASNPDGIGTTMYDDNPSGRASFGVYGSQPSNYIYFRENH